MNKSHEILSENRHWAKMVNDRYKVPRERFEREYFKLSAINIGQRSVKNRYRGTRGSGYNNKTRAKILANWLDMRRTYCALSNG